MPGRDRSWVLVGTATVGADGEPQFPKPDFRAEWANEKGNIPGIYRLSFTKSEKEYVWIGKTCDLLRCPFEDYRRPADGVERDNVVHDILVDAGGARVWVIAECQLDDTRAKAEKQEQERAFEDKAVLLLNSLDKRRRGRGYGRYLRFKADYHKRIYDKTLVELQGWTQE